MCGVPYHSADGYVARLIRSGFKAAICDQMELPGPGKKLVRRAVVRVITPGTATDVAGPRRQRKQFPRIRFSRHRGQQHRSLRSSISPPANSSARNYPARLQKKRCVTNCNSCIHAKLFCLAPRSFLKPPRLPCSTEPAESKAALMTGLTSTTMLSAS